MREREAREDNGTRKMVTFGGRIAHEIPVDAS